MSVDLTGTERYLCRKTLFNRHKYYYVQNIIIHCLILVKVAFVANCGTFACMNFVSSQADASRTSDALWALHIISF